MSSGNIVRNPLTVREHTRRAVNQTLAIRLPGLSDLGARLIARLPPTSRIRQAVMWRAVRQGAEAFNRRDFEAVLIGRHPRIEFNPPAELVQGGYMDAAYSGRAGYIDFVNQWLSAWGEFRGQPRELIDLGDRLVLIGEVVGRGEASGVPVRQDYAVMVTFEDGRVIREQYYLDPTEAVAAAGVPASER